MKVILYMAISVNGFIAGEGGNEDFLSEYNWKTLCELAKRAGCLIWGRKTYELVKKWDKKYIESLKGIKKIIISKDSSLKMLDEFFQAKSPEEALEKLSEEGFKNVILTGGSTINGSFAELGLIDEIILNVEPAILGKGIKLFAENDFYFRLELLRVKKLSKGILQIHYKIKK